LAYPAIAAAAGAEPRLVQPSGDVAQFSEFVRSRSLFDLTFQTNGVAWIAASDGLHRYDGYDWTLYGTNHGLPSSYVRTVNLTPEGVLWCGTDQGAGTFDGKSFRLIAPTHRLAGPSVRRIRQQTDGSVWFCSDRWPPGVAAGGLTLLSNNTWRVFNPTHGLPSDHVYDFFRDDRGRSFVLTDRGAAQATAEGWRKVLDEPVWDMVQLPGGELLAFTESRRYLLRGEQWEAESFPRVARGNPHPPKDLLLTSTGEVLAYGFGRWTGRSFEGIAPLSMRDVVPEALREAPDGSFWCLDSTVLIRWQPNHPTWLEYTNLPPPSLVLPDGDLVFASEWGAFRKRGDAFAPISELVDDPSRLEADASGALWAWSSNSIRRLTDSSLEIFGPEVAQLTSFEGHVRDGQGRLFFYGRDATNALAGIRFEEGRWSRQAIPRSRNRRTVASGRDLQSGLWLSLVDRGGRGHFAHWDGTNSAERPWPAGAQGHGGATPLHDYEDNLWAFGGWGLARAAKQASSVWEQVQEVDVRSIVEAVSTPAGVWFMRSGMQGGSSGLLHYHRGNWTFVPAQIPLVLENTPLGHRLGLPPISLSQEDTVCVRGYEAVYLAPRGDLDLFRKISLPPGRSVPAFVVVDRARSVWIDASRPGGSSAVLAFRPDGIPPRAVIVSAAQRVPHQGIWTLRVKGVERWVPAHQAGEFTFSWRFDGQPWSRFTDTLPDALSVRALSPGRHRFEIRARDQGGDTQEEPTAVTMTVLPPPLQEQRWFRLLSWTAGLIMVLLALVALDRARKLVRTNRVLNREVEERRRAEDGLRQAQGQLRELNEQLEVKVSERTEELASALVQLRQEIAERQRVEQEQRKLEERMRQTQKLESLGILAGGVAHDFNNLLTAILGNADLAALDLPHLSPAHHPLKEIVTASRRAADLCQQMLAYSGRGRFVVEPVHLSRLVQETIQMLEVSIPKKIHLEFDLAEDVPWVEADATQLRQVIMNLVLNAAEAIGDRDGKITVKTRRLRYPVDFQGSLDHQDRLPEGPCVVLSVRDTGCGMDAATRQRMFDPFFSTKFTGRGLGLAAVLGIVRSHRGEIQVQTEPGQGTCFTIWLPASSAVADAPGVSPARPAAFPPMEARRTILLAEDEPGVRLATRKLLERLGFAVLEVPDGQAAVELVQGQNPVLDCALLDLTMPRLNGLEAHRELRRLRPQLPVVLASGYSEHEVAQKFSADGLNGFLQKPFSLEAVSALLRQVLDRA
jgi:signal transduction histidine kinase/CheY-like chemotaxis protein